MGFQLGLDIAAQPISYKKRNVQRFRQGRRWRRERAGVPAYLVADHTGTFPTTTGGESFGSTTSGDNEPPRNVTYRSLLRNNNFRLLWLGEAISTFGSMFTRLAIPVYVYSLTNSYRQLGLAIFWGLAASLVFGLVSGVFVDRWNRRTTMTGASVLNGVVLLALVGVIVWNPALPIQLVAIYALNFVTTLLRDLFAAARVAIFPDVLNENEYLVANALDQSTIQFAELLSYPLSILVLWLGPTLAFGLDAATFFVSALLLWRVRVKPAPVEASGERALFRDIAAGLRATWRLPLVRSIVLLSFIVPLIFSLMFTLQIPYAVDIAGSTEEVGFPLLEGAMALGFVIGAVLLGRSSKRWGRSTLLVGGIVGMGGGVLLQGVLPYLVGQRQNTFVLHPSLTLPLLLALPVLLLIGITNSLVATSIRTVVQERTPRTVLGRVFSVIQTASAAGFAVGALLTDAAEGRVPSTLIVMGTALIFIGLACSTPLRNAERQPPPLSALADGG